MADLGRTHPMQQTLEGGGRIRQNADQLCARCWQSSMPAVRPRCWRRPRCWPLNIFQTISRMLGELSSSDSLEAPEHATGVVLITVFFRRQRPSRGGDAPNRHG